MMSFYISAAVAGKNRLATDSSAGDLSVPKAFSSAVTFALGKISVSDKLYVTFELLRQ